jgi:tetratricopeptide (TPR) repeat protein
MADALRCYVEAEGAARSPGDLSEALRRQADVLRVRCEWEDAAVRATAAERIAREAGLSDHLAEAVNARAAVEQSRGELAHAAELYAQVMSLTTSARVRGCALQNLGALAAMQGDHDAAASFFEGSLTSFREEGYERGVAIALNNLGRASLDRGDQARAEQVLNSAVTQSRMIEDLELASLALVNYAEALLGRGETAQAEEEVSAALGFFKVSGNTWRQIECLRLLGDIRRARGEPEVAIRLYEQALLLSERIGSAREAAEVRARLSLMSSSPAA